MTKKLLLPAVIRMAVQIERMAMILSAMRMSALNADEIDGDKDRPRLLDAIYCSDEDYETAEMIGNKMLLHMAAAYRMIDGDKQDVVPEMKPIDQRKVLYEQLKGVYSLGELISEAKSQGVSRSSAIRWNNQWIEQGLINKEKHGNYKKIA